MNCKKCGNPLQPGQKFCTNCGEDNSISQLKSNNEPTNTIKKDNKKIILIIICIVCTCLAFVVGFFVGKSLNKEKCKVVEYNSNSNEEQEKEKEDDIDYTFNLFDPSKIAKETSNNSELNKNIEVYDILYNPYKSYNSKYREVYIYGKNNNSTAVEVKVYMEYYDSEGYRIESKTTTGVVSSEKEFVLSIYIADDSLEYTKIKLIYEATKIKSYYTEIPTEKIEITATKLNSNDINVVLKNNSNIEMKNGSIACLYYKNGKVVYGTTSSIFNIKPKESGQTTFYESKLYLNDNYNNREKIEYDNYKVFLVSAYDYDSVNY